MLPSALDAPTTSRPPPPPTPRLVNAKRVSESLWSAMARIPFEHVISAKEFSSKYGLSFETIDELIELQVVRFQRSLLEGKQVPGFVRYLSDEEALHVAYDLVSAAKRAINGGDATTTTTSFNDQLCPSALEMSVREMDGTLWCHHTFLSRAMKTVTGVDVPLRRLPQYRNDVLCLPRKGVKFPSLSQACGLHDAYITDVEKRYKQLHEDVGYRLPGFPGAECALQHNNSSSSSATTTTTSTGGAAPPPLNSMNSNVSSAYQKKKQLREPAAGHNHHGLKSRVVRAANADRTTMSSAEGRSSDWQADDDDDDNESPAHSNSTTSSSTTASTFPRADLLEDGEEVAIDDDTGDDMAMSAASEEEQEAGTDDDERGSSSSSCSSDFEFGSKCPPRTAGIQAARVAILSTTTEDTTGTIPTHRTSTENDQALCRRLIDRAAHAEEQEAFDDRTDLVDDVEAEARLLEELVQKFRDRCAVSPRVMSRPSKLCAGAYEKKAKTSSSSSSLGVGNEYPQDPNNEQQQQQERQLPPQSPCPRPVPWALSHLLALQKAAFYLDFADEHRDSDIWDSSTPPLFNAADQDSIGEAGNNLNANFHRGKREFSSSATARTTAATRANRPPPPNCRSFFEASTSSHPGLLLLLTSANELSLFKAVKAAHNTTTSTRHDISTDDGDEDALAALTTESSSFDRLFWKAHAWKHLPLSSLRSRLILLKTGKEEDHRCRDTDDDASASVAVVPSKQPHAVGISSTTTAAIGTTVGLEAITAIPAATSRPQRYCDDSQQQQQQQTTPHLLYEDTWLIFHWLERYPVRLVRDVVRAFGTPSVAWFMDDAQTSILFEVGATVPRPPPPAEDEEAICCSAEDNSDGEACNEDDDEDDDDEDDDDGSDGGPLDDEQEPPEADNDDDEDDDAFRGHRRRRRRFLPRCRRFPLRELEPFLETLVVHNLPVLNGLSYEARRDACLFYGDDVFFSSLPAESDRTEECAGDGKKVFSDSGSANRDGAAADAFPKKMNHAHAAGHNDPCGQSRHEAPHPKIRDEDLAEESTTEPKAATLDDENDESVPADDASNHAPLSTQQTTKRDKQEEDFHDFITNFSDICEKISELYEHTGEQSQHADPHHPHASCHRGVLPLHRYVTHAWRHVPPKLFDFSLNGHPVSELGREKPYSSNSAAIPDRIISPPANEDEFLKMRALFFQRRAAAYIRLFGEPCPASFFGL